MKLRLDRLIGTRPLPLADQIEQAGAHLAEESSQKATWNFISLLQRAVSEQMNLYVPMLGAQSEDLDHVDALDLHMFVLPRRDLFCKVELEKGGEAYCAFLKPYAGEDGPAAEYIQIPAEEIFRIAFEDKSRKGLILDPWNLSALLSHELLSLILNEDGQSAACSLYISRGEAADQNADVIVSIAQHPFSSDEPGPGAVFERGGQALIDTCQKLDEPAPGEIVVTSSEIGSSSSIFHAALPLELTEDTLKLLLEKIMSLAMTMGYTSVALPALGNEEAPIESDTPFAILAISGWMCRHPECGMSVTISARNPETYDLFCSYLFGEDDKNAGRVEDVNEKLFVRQLADDTEEN